jgi:hypothetical protein
VNAHVQNQLNEFIHKQFREEDQLSEDLEVDAFDYVDVSKKKKLTKNQKSKKQ